MAWSWILGAPGAPGTLEARSLTKPFRVAGPFFVKVPSLNTLHWLLCSCSGVVFVPRSSGSGAAVLRTCAFTVSHAAKPQHKIQHKIQVAVPIFSPSFWLFFYPNNPPFLDPPGPGLTPGWGIKVPKTSFPIGWGVLWCIIQFPG